MRHLNYNHLLYFWTVANEGGVARAAEALHLTPQTISGQLRLLEEAVGEKLFQRRGRALEMTETGKLVLRYADEIFELGTELAQVVRRGAPHLPAIFSVGVVDGLPKLVAFRILEPVMRMQPPMRLVCREGSQERLLGELALHNLDMVLADAPMPSDLSIRAFSHPLGESAMSFLAPRKGAAALAKTFPKCLDRARLLLPTVQSVVRRALDRWFDEELISPDIVAEFDDSALLKSFAQAGAGIMATPTMIETHVAEHYHLSVIGRTHAVREQFFAITPERRVRHPAVKAVTETARTELFSAADST